MEELQEFLFLITDAFTKSELNKITLSKTIAKDADLQNIYIKPLIIKNEEMLSFTFRYKTNDQVKNFSFTNALKEIEKALNTSFLSGVLMANNQQHTLLISKKGTTTLLSQKASKELPQKLSHDNEKVKRAEINAPYLVELGVCSADGKVIPAMADKYRQINKYLEIIENQMADVVFDDEINIVDMGSGKGYLTFALYDYLKNTKELNVNVYGVELRNELVEFCNKAAKKCNFKQLTFVSNSIQDFKASKIDILIALHACDTATDDAIYKGLVANSQLIICAPCCHKQIRQQSKGKTQENPMLKYGIFKERHFEMLTDTMRALILEEKNYKTHIFEFISNEHTRKNIMLVASKNESISNLHSKEKLETLKKEYQIEFHYLEKLIKEQQS